MALALALAVLFVRLGLWQVDRLSERRAYNAQLGARLGRPAVPLGSLGAAEVQRRVILEGTPDYEHEFVHAGRSRNGSPGVHVFTPVRRSGSDTAVFVNRGWIYSPDASTVDLSRFRETRTRFSGIIQPLPEPMAAVGTAVSKARVVRSLSIPGVRAQVPYPVSTRYVVSLDSSSEAAPVRLAEPRVSDGSHLSYAIQWFCFALIALGGAGAVVYRDSKARRAGSTAA